VNPLGPLLVGRLFLAAFVTHDALAFAIAALEFLIAGRPLPGLDVVFPRHFLISLPHGETTRLRPESSCNGSKMTPQPTGTASRATSF
jgi:hypothetical protein